jgi:uncharacterized C2H2 Zn-finger protein
VEPMPASVIKQDGAITMTCGSCGHVWRVTTREPLLLKCPRCGKPLAILKGHNATRTIGISKVVTVTETTAARSLR